ncbi:MAG TPA: hypothetical protein PLV45_19250 [bacterium]|nr:hypothetical protein [bacterium]
MKSVFAVFIAGILLVSAAGIAGGIPKYNAVRVAIDMPATHYGPGDEFWMNVETLTLSGQPIDCRLVIMLQIYDSFYLYPGWNSCGPPDFNMDWEDVTVQDEVRVIFNPVTFPDDLSITIDGLQFAAVCASEHWEIISNIDRVYWSIGP